jgi:rsbT antagonist protein RsbS
MERSSVTRVPLQLSRDCVVASVQVDLRDEILRQFRVDLLEYLHETGASGVIIDVSGVEIMDADDFEALRRTLAMAEVMGAQPVIVGLRPGVISSLIDLGVDPAGIKAAFNLDDGFDLLERLSRAKAAAHVVEPGQPEDDFELAAPDDERGEPGGDEDTNRE